jgi:cytochrome c553
MRHLAKFPGVLAWVLILGLNSLVLADEPRLTVPVDHAARMKQGLKLFQSHVRETLVKNCVDCHGGRSTKADFNLASREALMASGYVGETAADSYLLEIVRHEAEPYMPLQAPKLSDEAITHLARWIDLGAPYDKPLAEPGKPDGAAQAVTDDDRNFWAFRPLQETQVPNTKDSANWCRNPIDRFILDQLHAQGLKPNPEADRRTLIRRLSLDLLGLPPSPERVEAFVNDPSPDAYETLVDEMLDSSHYGERWARHWMDVARFAESTGFEHDYDRKNAYHYRDFLIRALNDDLPYNEFVAWQLAGDEIAPDNPNALAATGFLGAGVFPTQITETEFESARYDELDDMVSATSQAFLGLSVGCARCHDHKFDPVPAADYYRMAAAFTGTIRSEIERTIDGQKVTLLVSSEQFSPMKHHADGRGYPHRYPETHILSRGDVHQKTAVAEPSFLQVLMPGADPSPWQIVPDEPTAKTSYHRTALAHWITDVDRGAGSLAARVMVNRLWQHHFGEGLVSTPNDFGVQGSPPTHPELLEWLAGELVSGDWRLKRLHRLMVTSSTYRQSSETDETRLKIDPDNAYLWRWRPRRLEAEPIRDSVLSVSGKLDPKMFGPGTLDESMTRRSIYFTVKRSQLIPMMMLFDWPEHLVSIGDRATTTTAPQALVFLNSPHVRRWAEAFAARVAQEGGEGVSDRIDRAYRLAFSRPATEEEIDRCRTFLEMQEARYREAGRGNGQVLALADLCQAILGMNEFLYIP